MGTTVIDSSDTPMTVEQIVALQREVREVAAERSAVILTHNSQRPEVQDVADFVGDSLALSREATGSEAEVIAFCGVHFMAETASILSPDKTVLLPDLAAGCSLGTRSPQPSCGPGRRGTRARSW